ncbi:flavodoxin domain-containing protein [Microvirga sp. HBU67558]|uniref:diflavin oxidoreductase n=1 Tax=Microvirga TaxID=186650 RepID=UPI001B3916AD|nr:MULTISPECIES: flavodoxin domain-containing protein [unclassified Microvirga]MBQ0822712.1 flavodoxin domain-containing protein [Microvirga sp. HBU67558]
MSAFALLPQTAPFGDDDRLSLDRVLSAASPIQRAWLAGFLAGIDAGQAPLPRVDAPARASEPLTILFASESGNAERLAQDVAKLARKDGFKPKIVDFADLDVADLPQHGKLVVIAATWGEGEPPGRAARAYAALMGPSAPRLEGTSFAVLALGDTAYAEFCGVGKALDARLAELGAVRAADRVDCDLDFEAPAAAWIKTTLAAFAPAQESPAQESSGNVVSVDFGPRVSVEPSRDAVIGEVIEHVNLSSSRSDKETIHLALGFDGAAPAYEPGDALELFPENDPALVDAVLAATGLQADDSLRTTLTTERDITTLAVKTLETFAAETGHAELRRLLDEGQARSWIDGRQFIDLVEAYPVTLTAQQLTALTRPLPPRAYSIASSRREVGDEAHLLIAAVRYEAHGRVRRGVASTFVADRLKAGAAARVRLKPNKHFRLPEPSTDIIMIGPGTGIAPFRAFVQERRALGAGGRSWLFFGDRRYTHDFLYQLEWQDALRDGSLARLDLAFSRDTPQKVYVQHRLWEQRRDLVDWLDNGAQVYVCGDAKAMAKDVRAALVAAFADVKALSPEAAEHAVTELERGRRYYQDVY